MSIPLRFARGGNLARVSIPNVSCKALRLPHTVRLPQKAAYFGSEKWVVDLSFALRLLGFDPALIVVVFEENV